MFCRVSLYEWVESLFEMHPPSMCAFPIMELFSQSVVHKLTVSTSWKCRLQCSSLDLINPDFSGWPRTLHFKHFTWGSLGVLIFLRSTYSKKKRWSQSKWSGASKGLPLQGNLVVLLISAFLLIYTFPCFPIHFFPELLFSNFSALHNQLISEHTHESKLNLFSSLFIPSTANAFSSSQTFQNVAKKKMGLQQMQFFLGL